MEPTHSERAVKSCQLGIDRAVRFQADAMQHIDHAIDADASYCLPRVIKAWMLQGANDVRYSTQIAELVNTAQQLLPAANSKEAELLAALRPLTEGQKHQGASALARLLDKNPTNTFIHMLAQEETFWLGDSAWMRKIVEQAAPHWSEQAKDFGPFLSMRAFANEEAGYFQEAERYGMAAVEMDPTDVWGAHAVAHVLLMKGEINRGIDWLDGLSGNWSDANQMQHHLWWHYCLFLLERREHDQILSLLDTKIRNPDSALIKASPAATIDINNYASLLLRLELYGVDVSNQWQTLVSICTDRVNNHASVFSNIHDMMVLTACGKFRQSDSLLQSMASIVSDACEPGSLENAYKEVGIPVCQALLAYQKKNFEQVLALLGKVRHRLHLMGASHAQRDVFYHLLVYAAAQTGREDLIRRYLQEIEQLGFCDVPARAAYGSLAR